MQVFPCLHSSPRIGLGIGPGKLGRYKEVEK